MGYGVTLPCSQENNSANVNDEIEWDSDFEDFEYPPVKVSKLHSPEILVSFLLVMCSINCGRRAREGQNMVDACTCTCT